MKTNNCENNKIHKNNYHCINYNNNYNNNNFNNPINCFYEIEKFLCCISKTLKFCNIYKFLNK